jgi:hypothetical protein
MSPLLAQSRHGRVHRTCPLLGVKRTSCQTALEMLAAEPSYESTRASRTVGKAPSDVVVLIVATARKVLIFDSALAMKRMHVVDAATEATGRHHHLHHVRVLAGDFFGARAAFVARHAGRQDR